MERKWWTLIAVSVAIFMLLLDITVVNVALPDIQRSLHSSFSDLQWVVDAYALTLATFLLTAGSVADLVGRKRVFIAGLFVFTGASAVCGLSTTPLMLNLARAVQGTGGAMMFATSLALLAQAFHGKERGVAQMKQSAERLRSDVIDLMQIHNLLDWQVHLATLRRMKEQGRIRYLGITHYTAGALAELAAIIAREPIDFVQLGYSIESREAEARLLKLCIDRQVAVIVNQPFEQGGLFGKVRGRALPGWAADFDCTSWAQFFLKYLTGHPAITCVIPATAEPAHLGDDLRAGYGRLPDAAERRRMAAFWDAL